MTKQTTIDLGIGSSFKGPVTCLGQVYASEDERREHFRNLLREKLKDPDFRKIEGFPIGEDEDIIALSDPPYYTACPNPWINDFIAEWEKEKGDRPDEYHREPFAADVSEGKNDPIYNAHSYHTKVPHKAIMRYILHYTEPGDIVFDGFCGTGMTGVAAQLCGDKKVVESLGYQVKDDGTILDVEGKPFSKLGARKAILNDLSPAATFIAANYNSPVDIVEFEKEAKRILEEVEEECGWMYETLHPDGKTIGRIIYTVWSDVFICPNCSQEIIFWDEAIDMKDGLVLDEFPCPYCHSKLTKRRMERAFVTKSDKFITDRDADISGMIIRQAKQKPVLICYSIGKSRFQKTPDDKDLALIEKIEQSDIPYWFPTERMPEGDESRRNDDLGVTHVHHFYAKRNLWTLAAFWDRLPFNIRWKATSFLGRNLTKQNRFIINKYNPRGRINGPLTGTLYIPSEQVEQSALSLFKEKVVQVGWDTKGNVISTESTTNINRIEPKSVNYIFTDPPFGANFMYSELNFILESWLRIKTCNDHEAIENSSQAKSLLDYQGLMKSCFTNYYKALKSNGWMTVEFHNSKNSVWNAIQEALQQAGFVVADVRTLDKVHGGIKAASLANAVKQDLIISCYKPNGGIEERFVKLSGTEEGVWDFIRTHLKQLPKLVIEKGKMQIVAERQNYLLYDRMVAFYLQRNALVPLSSGEFYRGLEEHFPSRDGMYFLPEQVIEYDKTKMRIPDLAQMEIFITDEVSAIQWLRQLLKDKPQSFQDIHPQFMREIAGWNKNEKSLELSLILEENFLKYDGKAEVPSQVHTYLSTNWKELRNLPKDDPALKAKAKDRWYVPDPNKLADLEQMREKALLKEFWTYLPKDYKPKKLSDLQIEIPDLPKSNPDLVSGKRFKIIRAEAVRAGFKYCWQHRDYETIILVAKRIPSSLLEEDPKLLMYYDQAITRTQ
ncbi:MAG: site-specific DNA-methyltransferase [Candidatus Cloacimonetes bacterium]|nr:site-specific DNA-methyltransferase [Candidatus Cloacimonadota bacterium]